MKTLSIILSITFSILTINTINSQNIWKGGTPGSETKWEEPRNWSDNKVPGSFDSVIIPDLSSQGNFYPVIQSEVAPVAHIRIESGASLTLNSKGILNIDGSNTYNNGITLVGHLYNKGQINIIDPGMQAVEVLRNTRSVGSIAILDSEKDMLVNN